ncbi:MAG: FISUMP domain-containing protein, partial [Bacteroidales bacterium]
MSEIQKSSAVGGGNIINDGGDLIQQKGVCWSLNQYPTISDHKTIDGEGAGSFSSTLTGLNPGTPYYVRAYAVNSAGTAYGNQVSFTTAYEITLPTITTSFITSITSTTASGGGNITSDGYATVTARGICWSTSQNPTTSDAKTSNGSGTGSFTSNLIGLIPNTTYYVRAYATNTAGTAYGEPVSFKTDPGLPTVISATITQVAETTASGGGNVMSDGNAPVTARGMCWSTSQNPTITNSKTTDGAGLGVFTSSLTGLSPNTPYYVRAYATNSAGTAYGNQVTFNTVPVITLPMVITSIITNITETSATAGGNVTADGGAAVTTRGICWSKNPNPTTANWVIDHSLVPSFTVNLTGLLPNTTYYVRAFAMNSAGTGYGNEVSFKTLPKVVLPIIITTGISNITRTTAISGGNVISDGGASITARGVCWAPETDGPTTDHPHTTNGTGIGLFTSNMTGLIPNTRYFVRAYATNSEGTSYGDPISFRTLDDGGLTGSFIDSRDNTVYNWVKIGNQVWMSENLAYLPSVSSSTTGSGTLPYYYVQGYEGVNIFDAIPTSNYQTYGVLYNWPAAMKGANSSNQNPSGVQGICPDNWHLPSYS